MARQIYDRDSEKVIICLFRDARIFNSELQVSFHVRLTTNINTSDIEENIIRE